MTPKNMVVWKWPLPFDKGAVEVLQMPPVTIPSGTYPCKVLHVAYQKQVSASGTGSQLMLWAIVDPDVKERQARKFRLLCTGETVKYDELIDYVGTVQNPANREVYHIYEVR